MNENKNIEQKQNTGTNLSVGVEQLVRQIWQRLNANEEYKGIEDSIDILDIVQNNVSNISEPTEKEIKNINTWLRQMYDSQCLKCKHLIEGPAGARCKAFPNGIDAKYILNETIHDKVMPDQEGEYIFSQIDKKQLTKA